MPSNEELGLPESSEGPTYIPPVSSNKLQGFLVPEDVPASEAYNYVRSKL